jgi:hypothetical protein
MSRHAYRVAALCFARLRLFELARELVRFGHVVRRTIDVNRNLRLE